MSIKSDVKNETTPNFIDTYIHSVMEADYAAGIELLRLNRPDVFKILSEFKNGQSQKTKQ
jgi:hypothetical protein